MSHVTHNIAPRICHRRRDRVCHAYEWGMTDMNEVMSPTKSHQDVTLVNESCQAWMSHVTHERAPHDVTRMHYMYQWVMSHMKSHHESAINFESESRDTHEWVMPGANESCHTWKATTISHVCMRHYIHEWVRPHMKSHHESAINFIRVSHVTRMNKAWQVWMSHVTHEIAPRCYRYGWETTATNGPCNA